MSIWIDEDNCELNYNGDDVGDAGFLVCRTSEHGVETYSLRRRPAHTNSSHEPRLDGWCGSWNNVSTDACGLARVARQAKNGRLCLAKVTPTPELLEELGYPELCDEPEPTVTFERWLAVLDDADITLARHDGKHITQADQRRAFLVSAALLGDDS